MADTTRTSDLLFAFPYLPPQLQRSVHAFLLCALQLSLVSPKGTLDGGSSIQPTTMPVSHGMSVSAGALTHVFGTPVPFNGLTGKITHAESRYSKRVPCQ